MPNTLLPSQYLERLEFWIYNKALIILSFHLKKYFLKSRYGKGMNIYSPEFLT